MNQENELIKTYHVLILGALKKCHIGPHHPMFEDYLQIARWLLIDTHRYFIKEDKSFESFHNYVYQRIFWKITDEIRKDIHYTDRLCLENDREDEEPLYMTIPDTSQEELIEVRDILSRLAAVLTDNEKNYLEDAYIHDLTITQIAKKHQISRKTVYQWRNRVSLKSLIFFNK